uniref:riboflavin kinase n=1 Tax=Equus caballus TaxID=9796 RepID=A0A9L0SW39_HORSE
ARAPAGGCCRLSAGGPPRGVWSAPPARRAPARLAELPLASPGWSGVPTPPRPRPHGTRGPRPPRPGRTASRAPAAAGAGGASGAAPSSWASPPIDNLPADLSTGIYYGWASVGSGDVHRMMVSIGWNPYYKNTKKSMEAHSYTPSKRTPMGKSSMWRSVATSDQKGTSIL